MRKYFLLFFLLFSVIDDTFSQNEVSGKYFLVGDSDYKITYFSPSNLSFKNNNIRRLVIVLHGNSRTALTRQNDIVQAADTEGKYLETLIISPHFISNQELVDNNLDDYHLYWRDNGWMEGALSSSSGAYPREESFSSFEVIDDIISQIILGNNFPNLRQVVLTGFSGGGQFMNRYASSNRVHELFEKDYNIDFQYLIASPSSYMYFNEERRVDGSTEQFEKPNVGNCGLYNNYKYGTNMLNQYMKYYHLDTLINRYKRRKISYGVGSRDNNPNSSSMDDSCQAMFQGNHRLERATIFVNYLKHIYGDLGNNHKLYIAQGVNHNSTTFYNRNNIRPLLFPEITNEVETPLGIENNNKIKIYPTPGSKVLNIENINFSLIHDFKILDIFGREVKNFTVSSEKNTKMLVDTSKLSDGLYFIFFNTFEDSLDKRLKFVIRN
tara:strand:+ start:977 stop:2290 length:1314 start_codon:yes stop_codon:yes gene_type:complete